MAGVGGVIRNNEGTTLLAYSGPASLCSINKAEVLNIGLREALRFNPRLLVIEGDSSCAMKWASLPSSAPWYQADIMEEVVENSKKVNISFHLIKHDANSKRKRKYPIVNMFLALRVDTRILEVVNPFFLR
ncbi:hypothetical protein AAC387_Pa06g1488 [Persea americana]